MCEVFSILGCGWLGKSVATYFYDRNFQINASVTKDKAKLTNLPVKPYILSLPEVPSESVSFFDCDYLLIAFPPKGESGYAAKMNGLKLPSNEKIKGVIFISSTAVYKDGHLTHSFESYKLSDSTRAKNIISAENELKKLFGNKLTILRCGGLYGEGRHPGRFLSGKEVSNGRAPVNMISDVDVCRVIERIIELSRWGETYPLVHTEHPTKEVYYKHFAKKEGLMRPIFTDMDPGKTIDASFAWKDLNLAPKKGLM
ncbi:MAG: hypothetical protein ACK4K0_06950 [Flavobacteriales bacterium]